MRNKLIAIGIVLGFILFLGVKIGNAVSSMDLNRTNITQIGK